VIQAREAQHMSDLADWSVAEYSCPDSFAKETVFVKEDVHHDSIHEDKAKALVLKKFFVRLGLEDDDLQMAVFSR
jgi:hypothetical protein